jgi:hypothetical protein
MKLQLAAEEPAKFTSQFIYAEEEHHFWGYYPDRTL